MTETALHGEIFIQHIVWGLQYMLVPILCLEYKGVTISAVKMSRGDRIDGIISLFERSKCRIRVKWLTEPFRNQPNPWYYFLIWNIQVPNPSDMTNRTIWKSVVTAVNWFNAFFSFLNGWMGPNIISIGVSPSRHAILSNCNARKGPTHPK